MRTGEVSRSGGRSRKSHHSPLSEDNPGHTAIAETSRTSKGNSDRTFRPEPEVGRRHRRILKY